MVNIIRLTGLATAVVALGACGTKVTEADQRGEIVERAVNTCVSGFDQRRSQTPGVTPAGLESRRFCNCAVAKMSEGKSTEELKAMDNDHSLSPTEGRIVSSCLEEEARRAGVIEGDAPPPTTNRSTSSTTSNTSSTATPTTPTTPPPTPPRADRTPPRTTPAAPRRPSSGPIATPVSPTRPTTPTPAPTPPAPRPATPPPAATPRPSGPTSLLPRTMSTPSPPRSPSTRPPPEG